ncbi:MAG: C_GCAxxG_C_C family protein [Lachnospiraceae bacterium]|nr:C_GCAxxG_C_C family protein [Lachnospiraceae bacterium]
MSKYVEHAKELRSSETFHYNCGRSVIIPFAEDAGISNETAMGIGAYFGGGMKRGGACGATAGGLVVLGLFGLDDNETVEEYYRRLREKYEDPLDCSELLRKNEERGGEKTPFCNELIYDCVAIAEDILKEKGKL